MYSVSCFRLVSEPAARARFASGAKDFLRSHGFDGLLLEWHFPVCWQSDCSKGRWSSLSYNMK
jgi:chitinase